MGVDKAKLHDWYKNHLSDFTTPGVQKELHAHDIALPPPEVTAKQRSIDVPIVKPENMGEQMAVDEKYIAGEFYTLLTNGKTGKIALMAATTKVSRLSEVMKEFGDKRFEVKILTRDLSPSYDWFGRENFMNAIHVADKFHVLKHAFDALQDLRIYYRQKLLTQRRTEYEVYLKEKKINPSGVFTYKEDKLPNGETHRELLARSQYLLFKFKDQWTESQAQRAAVLFNHYPDIEKAYHLICSFRAWYSPANVDASSNSVSNDVVIKLEDWFHKVDQSAIAELLNFKSLVQRSKGAILNYFTTRATNAIAESNNSKIQSLLHSNLGARNLDFFYFRLTNYLS